MIPSCFIQARIHFASLYSTSVSNNCYSSFRVVVSIHHSERQKSQGDSAIIDTIDNLHTLITKCFVNRYGTGLFVMGVCKIYRMHTPRSRNRRQHGSLRTKNKTLCTPLGVRRQVKTLYLIHLNEVPKSTPYHLRNSLLTNLHIRCRHHKFYHHIPDMLRRSKCSQASG